MAGFIVLPFYARKLRLREISSLAKMKTEIGDSMWTPLHPPHYSGWLLILPQRRLGRIKSRMLPEAKCITE